MKEEAQNVWKYALHCCISCCDQHIKEGEEMKIKTPNIENNQIAALLSENEKIY